MPAPAVYILAVVGTVGAVIVFKEFVYEPHIAPRIDRWKAEFQAARRRTDSSSMTQVPLIPRGAGKDGDQHSEEDDYDSDNDGLGKGPTTLRSPVQPYMKNGLLIRRRSDRSQATTNKPADIELDDWITGTSTAVESQQPDMRSRKHNDSLNYPIPHPSRTPTNISPDKTNETAFSDQSIQAIPYTPISPIQTPTPTRVLTSSSDSPFSIQDSLPLPETTSSTKVTGSLVSHPLLQHPSPSNTSVSKAPFTLSNTVSQIAPLLPVNVDSNLHPLVSPAVLPLPSPQSLSPPASLYQTPHIHAIPSLSQSYPLDDLLDYEHGLELLSPPSPLSRTDSPFELAGLSPRPAIEEGSSLLLARGGDGMPAPVDGITNSSRSVYLSFPSSPASSVSVSSENGYENDSSRSEISSTFSSPLVAPIRLGLRSDHNQQQESTVPSSSSLIDDADTQTLSPRNRNRSPWTTGSELSDLDFSSEEYETLGLSPGAGRDGSRGVGRSGEGHESDTSNWSFAGSSE